MMCVFRKCHPGARSAIGSIAITSLLLFLVACGDDESSFTSRPGDDSSTETSSSVVQSSSERSGGNPSSSSVKSSSSSVKSSGSSSSRRSAWEYLNPDIDYGEFVDERDGKVYKTVRIGDQVWMAENLNFEVENSFCYGDSKSSCDVHGRLYMWSAALGKGEGGCTYGREGCPYPSHIRGACPTDWHLPTTEEWETLIYSPEVGGQGGAGKALKATGSWTTYKGITRTNSTGFSILASGYRPTHGRHVGYEMGTEARFWAFSVPVSLAGYAPCFYFTYSSNGAAYTTHDMELGYSVRCIMDEDKVPPVSSSSAKSSSSVESSSSEQSSSSKIGCKSETEDICEYGELVDERDGQVYKTVKIGDQWWMAENLNYQTRHSYCYGEDSLYRCSEYGRLYIWSSAMDSVGKWGTNGIGCGYQKNCSPAPPVHGVCPEGWHLPTRKEWSTLFAAVGDSSTTGKVLKSTSGWTRDGNGIDAFGFSVFPAGYGYYTRNFNDRGEDAHFWTSDQDDWRNAYCAAFDYDSDIARLGFSAKYDEYSVRCLKDDDEVTPSSSSEEPSSEAWATECKTKTEDNCEYGELVDERDGKVYKTVKIGGQVWMAQNLNYAHLQPTDELDSSSFCYDDNETSCAKFGRFYLWSAAMDSAGTWSTDGKGCGYGVECSPKSPVRGVCPEGWHLPNNNEWNVLIGAVGGASEAGKKLKSTSEWTNNSNGTDAYGFTAEPAGYMTNKGDRCAHTEAAFWSSTEASNSNSYIEYLSFANNNTLLDYTGKNYRYTVRCIKDSSD